MDYVSRTGKSRMVRSLDVLLFERDSISSGEWGKYGLPSTRDGSSTTASVRLEYRLAAGNVYGSDELKFRVGCIGSSPPSCERFAIVLEDGSSVTPYIKRTDSGTDPMDPALSCLSLFCSLPNADWNKLGSTPIARMRVERSSGVHQDLPVDGAHAEAFRKAVACIDALGLERKPFTPPPVAEVAPQPLTSVPVIPPGTHAAQPVTPMTSGTPAERMPERTPTTDIHVMRPTRIDRGSRQEVIQAYESRVDSLCRALESSLALVQREHDQGDKERATINEHARSIVDLKEKNRQLLDEVERLQLAQKRTAVSTSGTLTEDPSSFGALAVHTLLHVFSDTIVADTFRVITRNSAAGPVHELVIAGKEAQWGPVPFYAPEVAGSEGQGVSARVNAALSAAFITSPISTDDYLRSNRRAENGRRFDLTKQEFVLVFDEKPREGFSYQSAPGQHNVLVYSRTLGRIVNVAERE